MPANIDLGDYEIDEDSNGDLVIKDPNDNEVMKWDEANANWDFGANSLDNIGSVNTEQAGIKEFSDYAVNVSEFDTIQAAIDYASSNNINLVYVPQGEYTESITVPRPVRVVGATADDSSVGGAQINSDSANETVVLDANRAQIESLRVGNTGTGGAIDVGSGNNNCVITKCAILDDVTVDGDRTHLTQCSFFGDDITLTTNTDGCVVTSNTNVGTITDNGTGNVISNNS